MVLVADHTALMVNQVLASMPAQELEQLRSCVLRVPLVSDQVLADYGQYDDHAFFIERGVVSFFSEPLDGEDGIQVAMVGREGMIGGWLLMNSRHVARVRVVVHVPGTAFRVSGSDLRQAVERSPVLRDACECFAQSLTTQIMQTATCNARRSLVERCARWLVMTRERLDGDEIRVTHESLSAMLGMRRSGVTVAAAVLQQAGLIRTGRGRFIVLDLARLRSIARGNGLSSAVPPNGAIYGGAQLGAVL